MGCLDSAALIAPTTKKTAPANQGRGGIFIILHDILHITLFDSFHHHPAPNLSVPHPRLPQQKYTSRKHQPRR